MRTFIFEILLFVLPFLVVGQSVSPMSFSFDSPASSGQILTITTCPSCSWRITPSDPWIDFSGDTTGIGNTTSQITVKDNPSRTDLRVGSIAVAVTFASVTQTAMITVTQSFNPVNLTQNESEITVPFDAHFFSYPHIINSDYEWSAVCSSTGDWLKFDDVVKTTTTSGTAGSPIYIYYSVDENVGSTRVGTITFTSGTVSITFTVTQEGPEVTSIKNLSEDIELSVYPNPSQGIVNITSKAPTSIQVLSVEGSTILQKEPATIHQFILPKGLYFLQVESDNKLYTQKLIIE